jgi:NADPH:quinone reductase
MRALICRQWGGIEQLQVITHRLPLERAVEGIRLLTDRQAHGKIVVELEPA